MPSPSGLEPLGNVQPGALGVVPLLEAFPDLNDIPVRSVHAVLFQAHEANVDKTYVMRPDGNITNDIGIIYVMVAPTSTFIPGLGIDAAVSQNGVPLHQLAVGAVNGNDKVRVSVLVV